MGNKNPNKNYINKRNIKDKSFTLCPLVNDRELLIEKKVVSNSISCLGIIFYKEKDFILLGYDLGKIEIYNSETLESVAEDHDEIQLNEYIRYVGQLLNEDFVIVSQQYVRIYAFYSDNFSSDNNEGHNYYSIQLLQKIVNPLKSSQNDFSEVLFSKAFYFDRNLYREYDIHQKELDKNKRKKNKNFIENYPKDEELIISSHKGIFIFENFKTKKKEKNLSEENSEAINQFDIYSYLENWKNNPYTYREQISTDNIYDMMQVNFKYIAGTIKDYLCLYSMETYELVTKFSVKISEDCDSVIFMLKEDILCLAGNDTIYLISMKDFEIILVSLIKKSYKITEICILPDYNILIGMKNNNNFLSTEHIEYFYQYKCFHTVNKSTKKMEYSIIKVSSKLLTKNYSNITMRCLSDNRLVTIIDTCIIQVWK